MKKIWKGLAAVAAAAALASAFSGCAIFGSSKPEAPAVTAVGNVLLWDAVEGAEGYEVFCNGVSAGVTNDTFYVVRGAEQAAEYSVAAVKGEKQSDRSTIVTVEKTKNFGAGESMEIVLESETSYTIPSSVNYVSITGEAEGVTVVIAERLRTLYIDLNEASFSSPEGQDAVFAQEYDPTAKKAETEEGEEEETAAGSAFSVILNVTGENTIAGSNYRTVPAAPAANSGKKGTNGGRGGNAVCVPQMVLTGSGSLSLIGGGGGNGGQGADSSGLSFSSYGKGGNGGNGGSGIACDYCVVAMDIAGLCVASGGAGGTGGTFGANGSLITGPINSAISGSLSGAEKDRGKNGQSGVGCTGEVKIISGGFRY